MKRNDKFSASFRSSIQCGRGFALIATISVMVLLVLISLAMLTLSTVEIRQARQADAQSVAQANARMALMLAIGQLQESTGPDQRVTATASIFDSSPETLEIDGVNLPYALGSWSTVTDAGDPLIYRSDDGYMADRRNPADGNHLDHRQAPRTWLISGAQEALFDPVSVTLNKGQDAVEMGSHKNSDILAPLVKYSANGSGAYAYHVTDLGMAAPIVQLNEKVDEAPSLSSVDDGGYANQYTGSKRPYDKIAETKTALSQIADDAVVADEDAVYRYVTYGTGVLAPDGSLNEDARDLLREYRQELTTHSSALMVDTLIGGFRTDLTPFMKDNANAGNASLVGKSGQLLNDTQSIVSHVRFNSFSPKFGALRDYIQLGNLAGSNREIAPRTAMYGGGASADYPNPVNVIKQGVHPYIVEYSVFTRPVINSSSSSNMSMLIYPRVTLWNPYNVAIDTSGYFVQINQRGYMVIEVDDDQNGDGSYDRYSFTDSYWGSPHVNDGAKARPKYFFFYLDPVKIQPGQSLVFSPAVASSQKIEFRDGDITKNRLSASADISDLGCFYTDMGGAPADTAKSLNYKFLRYWDSGYHIGYEESTSARLRIANSTANYASVIDGTTENPSFPIVHTLDIHNWIRGNEGRWHDINRPWLPVLKMTDANSVPPDNRTKLGIRLKAFNETAENTINIPNGLWNYPMLEMSNMRSPFYRRTPWDWIFQHPTVLHEFSFGPFATDCQEQPGYLDPFMLPRYINGVSETSPFMDTSSQTNLRYVLFDVPPAGVEAFSMAQFRQATLTHEFSAPTYIIGESLVPVTATRDKSALPVADYTTFWWQGLHQSRVPNYSTWWQTEYDPASNYAAFDYRFESNHALWDRYFFSTLPAGQSLKSYSEPGSLPHRWMRVTNDAGADLADLDEAKADAIARHVRLRNHHSVNSTSPLAWKALLAMNMGMDIGGKNTGDDQVPFPGISQPQADGTMPADSVSPETWKGYRQLSEGELDELTAKIIEQVKRRAPFISVSDFVNRRLREATIAGTSSPSLNTQSAVDLLSYAGPLEVAIRQAALNAGMQDYPLTASADYVGTAHSAPKFDTINMPTERFANAPAHLTQGKILENIGAQLTARSDTFRIRAYGESRDASGKVLARAWCEAVVQRSSEYVDPAVDEATKPFDQLSSGANKKFGRRYTIESFRWLASDEV